VAYFGVAGYILSKRIKFLRRNIFLGRKGRDPQWTTLKTLEDPIGFWSPFGPAKNVFKTNHSALLSPVDLCRICGDSILEVLEFILDGIIGTHRLFAPFLGGVTCPPWNMFEFLQLQSFLLLLVFLTRRYVTKVEPIPKNLKWKAGRHLTARLFLVVEIILMMGCCWHECLLIKI